MSQAEPGAPSKRPNPVILGLGVAVVAVFLVFRMWPAASPEPAPSNQPRDQRPVATTATGPGELDVRLGKLQQPPPQQAGENRNPFRFYVKPPPPPPPAPRVLRPGDKDYVAPLPPPPPAPGTPGHPDYVPPPPPIPLKFLGTLERGGKKWAIFSDGGNVPRYATEGDLVLGQYKLIKIGAESVDMEYADGRGRQRIPMRGQ
jgi:hypothetical protein